MAVCTWCSQEMTTGVSCKVERVKYPDGSTWSQIPNGEHRCHDCACPPFALHHPGCDMERCPRCGGQLISCGCLDEKEDDEATG